MGGPEIDGQQLPTSTPPSPVSPTDTIISGGTTLIGDKRTDSIAETLANEKRNKSIDAGTFDVENQSNERPPRPKHKRTCTLKISNPFAQEPDPIAATETNIRKLEETANGYPRLAAFQASETNFALYRGFSYLHSRVILDLQDELTTLEKELDEFDDYEEKPERLKCRSEDVRYDEEESEETGSEFGEQRTRRKVLSDIKVKLIEYDKFLIRTRALHAFTKPADRNYRSLRRYMFNSKPLMDSDMDSIRCKEDILSLRNGREWAGFDGLVETFLQVVDQKLLKPLLRTEKPPLQSLFRTAELQEKTSNKHINFYSATRIDALIGVLITLIIFALLVLPVVAMYKLSSMGTKASTFDAVGVLVVFTLLFSAAMSLVTKAERHELFAASAAYCAILVVFIGNFAQQFDGGFTQ